MTPAPVGNTVQKERLTANWYEDQRTPSVAHRHLIGKELRRLYAHYRWGLVGGYHDRLVDPAYGDDGAETIRANANTHLLLPSADLRECQYYSERIGNTTVPTWTHSRKPGARTGLADSWTQSEAQRRLLTPEEIRTLPLRSVLLLRLTLPPILLTAAPYYEDQRLSRLANILYEVTRVRPEPPTAPPEQLRISEHRENNFEAAASTIPANPGIF